MQTCARIPKNYAIHAQVDRTYIHTYTHTYIHTDRRTRLSKVLYNPMKIGNCMSTGRHPARGLTSFSAKRTLVRRLICTHACICICMYACHDLSVCMYACKCEVFTDTLPILSDFWNIHVMICQYACMHVSVQYSQIHDLSDFWNSTCLLAD